VGKGDGLLNLEYHAKQITESLTVDIEVYGFDSGQGLPEPRDYRDLPYHWHGGQYAMNQDQIWGKLKGAKLIIGDIEDTLGSFFEKYDPAPIGAVSFDFDYYSSTRSALEMFKNDHKYFLPRLFCYFDDTIGNTVSLMSDYTGERLAINEFNDVHASKKFSKAYFFQARKITQPWHHKIWIYHDFSHPRYADFVGG
jgi:hypothetical protein